MRLLILDLSSRSHACIHVVKPTVIVIFLALVLTTVLIFRSILIFGDKTIPENHENRYPMILYRIHFTLSVGHIFLMFLISFLLSKTFITRVFFNSRKIKTLTINTISVEHIFLMFVLHKQQKEMKFLVLVVTN